MDQRPNKLEKFKKRDLRPQLCSMEYPYSIFAVNNEKSLFAVAIVGNILKAKDTEKDQTFVEFLD